VENRDFVEKTDNGQGPLLPTFDIDQSELRIPCERSPRVWAKTHLLCDSDHELIGITGICPRMFLLTDISFPFFE
jgi:hypothetical protein